MKTTQPTSDCMVMVEVKTYITEQRIKDLICNAWEGGSAYWCQLEKVVESKEAKREIARLTTERKAKGDYLYRWEYPFIEGVTFIFSDATGEGFPKDKLATLDREKLCKGMQIMAEKYPQHFQNFITENDDAETGDVYLQCCVFGEVIFG